MVRGPSYNDNGLKKGAWSKEEDDKLRSYIQRYGHWNWRQIPRFAGLSRCGKSCRLRWMNYLKPNVKRGNYTKEEDEMIIKLRKEFGTKWSVIASKLSGRTDNDIKNHWHTKLKKLACTKPSAPEVKKDDQTDKPSDSATEGLIENQLTSSQLDSASEANCLSKLDGSRCSEQSFSSDSSTSLSLSADLWEDNPCTSLMANAFADIKEYLSTIPFPEYTHIQPEPYYDSSISSEGEIFEFQFHNQLYEDNV